MIPRVIHRIWVGGQPLPAEYVAFGETWAKHHPDWEHCLWTDEDFKGHKLFSSNALRTGASFVNQLRLEVLAEHGGVYVDTDVECLRPIDELLKYSAFACEQKEGVCNAVIGAVPNHEAILWQLEESKNWWHVPIWGVRLFTEACQKFDSVHLLPSSAFYPYLWYERDKEPESKNFLTNAEEYLKKHPDTYGIHRWRAKWGTINTPLA